MHVPCDTRWFGRKRSRSVTSSQEYMRDVRIVCAYVSVLPNT